MTETDPLSALMDQFMAAYQAADAKALSECVSTDFVWHQHSGPETPNARTLTGVDALVKEIKWRQSNWRKLRYDAMQIRSAGDMIVQTFRVSGIDHNGVSFDVQAVDLYPVRDGRITAKDTYWKQVTPS